MKNQDTLISELENHTRNLQRKVQDNLTYEEKKSDLEEVRIVLNYLKIPLENNADNREKKLMQWQRIENRMLRTERLLDLGSPKIILKHEINWLVLMVEHLQQIVNGFEPKLTPEQEEDLKFQLECLEE